MVNYRQGKIYRLVSDLSGLQYIGSKCDTLSRRMSGHRSHYKDFLYKNGQFTTSFQVLENADATIVLIENFPCDSKEELHRRERFYIETTECVNKMIPTRTLREYYVDNKDRILERCKRYSLLNPGVKKKYAENNRDIISEKHKRYYKDNRESILTRVSNLRKANSEAINERKRKYYNDNKEYYHTKIECGCGSTISRSGKSQHEKSIKHQNFLKLSKE